MEEDDQRKSNTHLPRELNKSEKIYQQVDLD